jgi:DNA-binding transcriptional LysR family regulator
MPPKVDWDSQIGLRLRLRDLHVFFLVVERGSMAKAAEQLGVSAPAVSEVIANLEHAVGVKLLDRSPHGIKPTIYGDALIKGGTAAFDDLKQSIKEIEFLSDPTVGDVSVGCPETIAAILPPIVDRMSQRYPGIVLKFVDVIAPTLDLPQLRSRNIDLAIIRIAGEPKSHVLGEDLDVEVLFNDEVRIVVGRHNPLARRRNIKLKDLATMPWILPETNTLQGKIIVQAFRELGLEPPKINVVTFSVQLRMNLVADGMYLSTLPQSVVRRHAERWSLRALPIKLPPLDFPVAITTLRNRTLNPAVQAFIQQVRETAKLLA